MKNVPNHFANLSLEIAHEDDGMMWWKIIFLELFLYVVLSFLVGQAAHKVFVASETL